MISNFKTRIIASLGICLLVIFPAGTTVTFADDCTPPAQTSTGVHSPTGSDAATFVYQCSGQYKNMWTNAHYVYDPATNSRSPLDPVVYTYNNATGLWDTTVWDFSVPKNDYVADTVSVQTPPVGATTVGGPPPPAQNQATSNITPGASGSPTSTGAGTVGGVNLNGSGTTNINDNTGATMTNGVSSIANSGNATLIGGTLVGGASSGNVTSVATIVNQLQSTSNIFSDPNLMTFTANITGDVNGDLLLDPAQLSHVQPANANANLDNKVTVNNTTDSAINNDINVGATSGNATIDKGTAVGSATTGNANAVANIVNILNSAVQAGQSFVGVINITGNLNGDILLPPNFVDTLLASNVPHYNVNTSALTTTANVTNTNNESINNDVNVGAQSGNATVARSTDAGSATTGTANANLTVFNLTGNTVVATNDIMVFVNVLGSWYGMILNAPAGTTAASLGGGVSTNATATNDSTLNNTNNQSINNKINVGAQSGNASITDSTKAGNAHSGDATASANLTNMINDNLSLNGWFGLLFINVFGTWTGSFGINTAAGNPATSAPAATGNDTSTPAKTFQFIPKSSTFSNTVYMSNGTTANTSDGSDAGSNNLAKASVLAAKTAKSSASSLPQLASGHTNYMLPIIGGSLAILLLLAGERNRFFHRNQA